MTRKCIQGQQPASLAASTSISYWVYVVNDCEWWIAESLEAALVGAVEESGEDYVQREDARALTDEEMDRLTYVDDLYNETESEKRTFREEMARRVSGGLLKAEMFATTEI